MSKDDGQSVILCASVSRWDISSISQNNSEDKMASETTITVEHMFE